jgi:hypothetical protein
MRRLGSFLKALGFILLFGFGIVALSVFTFWSLGHHPWIAYAEASLIVLILAWIFSD